MHGGAGTVGTKHEPVNFIVGEAAKIQGQGNGY